MGVNVEAEGLLPVHMWKNTGSRGMIVARVHLHIKEVIKLAVTKAITVGWTRCWVKTIEPANPRRCHRCGSQDHLVRECSEPENGRKKQRDRDGTIQAVAI